MAKRFIDTKIWDKKWFRELETKKKLLWLYITTKCDHAGIWDADFEAASFFIGEKVTENDLDWLKSKLVPVKSNNGQVQYFFPSFVDYQYGYLKETSKPHLSVRKRLIDKGLKSYINKGLGVSNRKKLKGLKTLKDKEKDKDKLKEKEKAFEKDVFNLIDELNINEKVANDFIMYWTEMKPKGKKMKFEMQQTFDIKRRLVKWRDNTNEWSESKRSEYKRQKMYISNS